MMRYVQVRKSELNFMLVKQCNMHNYIENDIDSTHISFKFSFLIIIKWCSTEFLI